MFERAKAVIMVKPHCMEIREIRLPEITEDCVVVKTKFSAISTGTEMRLYDGLASEPGIEFPLVPGYEEVGEVVFVGKNVEGLKVGDRVMANEVRVYPDYCAAWGGQVEYAVKGPSSNTNTDECVKIQDNVSYEEAVVAYLASVAYKGVSKIPVREGDVALVIGQGAVGVSAAQILRLKGARVIVADYFDYRLKLVEKFSDYQINSQKEDLFTRIKDITGGKGADIVFEASGNAKIAGELVTLSRYSGRIHYQGAYTEPVVFESFTSLLQSDRIITGSCASNLEDKKEILKLIGESKFNAKVMISEIRPIDEAPKCYEEIGKSKDGTLKLLFEW